MGSINRRGFLQGLAAAGVAIGTLNPLEATGKLISIPSGKIFRGNQPFSIDKYGNILVNEVAPSSKTTVLQLHRWLQDMADNVFRAGNDILDITSPNPSIRSTNEIIDIQEGYYVTNPQYLTEGSITQKGELWAGIKTVGKISSESYAFINGEKAIRPGHINQCIRTESEGQAVIITTRRAGYTPFRFDITTQSRGINYGPIMEQKDMIL